MLQCKKIFDAEDNNNAAVSGYNVADKAEIEAIVCSSLHTNSIVNFCNSTSGDLILTLNGMSWTHACYQITRENWARQFQTRQSAAYTAMVNTVDKKKKNLVNVYISLNTTDQKHFGVTSGEHLKRKKMMHWAGKDGQNECLISGSKRIMQ